MTAYRLLLSLAAPLILARLVWRLLRGAETGTDLRQRLGLGGGAAGAVWIHGASNGELASARPLIDALRRALPDTPLVITANTVTGRALAEGWRLPQTTARLAPLDLRGALRRFHRAWRPHLLIVLENELWPNRIVTAPCPVAGIGTRMSKRSFRRWARLPRLSARLMARFALLCPQDADTARHVTTLGLPAARLGPALSLKAAARLPAPDPEALAALRQVFDRPDTFLAASTHAGEDETILAAFLAARRARPALKLILAPRHPARGPTLERMLRETGLPTARRSAGTAPARDTVLYLADTLGEMALWYRLAGLTFVGGSLVPRGGHTPFEPADADSVILHGPDTANFADPYAALDSGGGAACVTDAKSLTAALSRLAAPEAQRDMAAAATAILSGAATGAQAIDAVAARLVRLIVD